MNITCNRKYEQLRIYFDGLLHLQLKLIDLIGFQSWIHGDNEYFIEYYFSSGTKITTAHGDRNKWESVLNCLDKNIIVIG